MKSIKKSKTGSAIIFVSVLLVLIFALSVACFALRGAAEPEKSEQQQSEQNADIPSPESGEKEAEPSAKAPSEQAPSAPSASETPPAPQEEEPEPPPTEQTQPEDTQSDENASAEEESSAIIEQETKSDSCTISFLGNCILGGQYISDAFFADFPSILLDDDLSLCCLGGCFSEPDAAQFSTPYAVSSDYARIIRAAGIDAVNIANSFTASASENEYSSTVAALEANSITYIEDWSDCVFITESGIKIGLYASDGYVGSNIKHSISAMREAGAELIIACFTWDADNLDYYYENQSYGAHYAADCGADIVFGQGGESLEGIERYGDSIIIYNLGTLINSAYISEASHTAVIRLSFERNEDGSFQLSETSYIPYLSGVAGNNPIRLDPGTEEYYNILSALVLRDYDAEGGQ